MVEDDGIEPPTPACKAGALPAELILQSGDPYGIRTRVTAVKGRCLNHLTNGPNIINPMAESKGFEPLIRFDVYTISNRAPSANSDSSPMAPQVGIEPTTDRLTADSSTAELLRNNIAWQRPTLTGTRSPTTIGARELNFRVRYGNGCDLSAIITRHYSFETIIIITYLL